jgi:hypothetical protein
MFQILIPVENMCFFVMDVIMILITEPHKVCPFYEVIQGFMNYMCTLLEFHENLSFFFLI